MKKLVSDKNKLSSGEKIESSSTPPEGASDSLFKVIKDLS